VLSHDTLHVAAGAEHTSVVLLILTRAITVRGASAADLALSLRCHGITWSAVDRGDSKSALNGLMIQPFAPLRCALDQPGPLRGQHHDGSDFQRTLRSSSTQAVHARHVDVADDQRRGVDLLIASIPSTASTT
jgi:hypothetical protein